MARFPEDPITVYAQGQRITLFADFKDTTDAAADPDIGRWEYGITLPQDGDKAARPWVYRFEGLSVSPAGVSAADEKRFEVAPSPFYPPT